MQPLVPFILEGQQKLQVTTIFLNYIYIIFKKKCSGMSLVDAKCMMKSDGSTRFYQKTFINFLFDTTLSKPLNTGAKYKLHNILIFDN